MNYWYNLVFFPSWIWRHTRLVAHKTSDTQDSRDASQYLLLAYNINPETLGLKSSVLYTNKMFVKSANYTRMITICEWKRERKIGEERRERKNEGEVLKNFGHRIRMCCHPNYNRHIDWYTWRFPLRLPLREWNCISITVNWLPPTKA